MKIKISKNQWAFVGRKAGWMKTADTVNIEEDLKNKFPKIYNFLRRLPGFSEAINIANNIANNVISPEEANIDKKTIDKAMQLTSKIQAQLSFDFPKKESGFIDVRVMAVVILIILGISVYRSVAKSVSEISEARQEQYDKIFDDMLK